MPIMAWNEAAVLTPPEFEFSVPLGRAPDLEGHTAVFLA